MMKKCSHGTTASRASSIKLKGFHLGKGRGGSGIYFWAESYYYLELAKGWYLFQKSKNKYFSDSDSSGVILICQIAIENGDTFIDLEELDLKEAIIETANRLGKLENHNLLDICMCYDYFITGLEKKIGIKFSALGLRVAPPGLAYCYYPLKLVGAPYCYIIRDPNIVTIVDEKKI